MINGAQKDCSSPSQNWRCEREALVRRRPLHESHSWAPHCRCCRWADETMPVEQGEMQVNFLSLHAALDRIRHTASTGRNFQKREHSGSGYSCYPPDHCFGGSEATEPAI